MDRNSARGREVLSQSRGAKQQSLFRIQEEFREAGSANGGSWGIAHISHQRTGKVPPSHLLTMYSENHSGCQKRQVGLSHQEVLVSQTKARGVKNTIGSMQLGSFCGPTMQTMQGAGRLTQKTCELKS